MDYKFWKEEDFDTVMEATKKEFPIGCLISTLGGDDCWEVVDYTDDGAVDNTGEKKVFVELRDLSRNKLTTMSPFCFSYHKDDAKMTRKQLSRLRQNITILWNTTEDLNKMRRVLHDYDGANGMIDNLEEVIVGFSKMLEDYERIGTIEEQEEV